MFSKSASSESEHHLWGGKWGECRSYRQYYPCDRVCANDGHRLQGLFRTRPPSRRPNAPNLNSVHMRCDDTPIATVDLNRSGFSGDWSGSAGSTITVDVSSRRIRTMFKFDEFGRGDVGPARIRWSGRRPAYVHKPPQTALLPVGVAITRFPTPVMTKRSALSIPDEIAALASGWVNDGQSGYGAKPQRQHRRVMVMTCAASADSGELDHWFRVNGTSDRGCVAIVSQRSDTTAGTSAIVLHPTSCDSRCTFVCTSSAS